MLLKHERNISKTGSAMLPWILLIAFIGLMCPYYLPSQVASADSSTEVVLRECSQVRELRNFNFEHTEKAGYGLSIYGYYFCSKNAPSDFMCKCSIASVCNEFLDPWGRDIGVCGCCTEWVYILLTAFIVLGIIFFCFSIFVCCFQGSWIYDGYPPPITPMLPQRSAPIVVPANIPLPANIFRGYKSSDFISGHTAASMNMRQNEASRTEDAFESSNMESVNEPENPLFARAPIIENSDMTPSNREHTANLRRRNVVTSVATAPSSTAALPVERPISTDAVIPIFSDVLSSHSRNGNPVYEDCVLSDIDSDSFSLR